VALFLGAERKHHRSRFHYAQNFFRSGRRAGTAEIRHQQPFLRATDALNAVAQSALTGSPPLGFDGLECAHRPTQAEPSIPKIERASMNGMETGPEKLTRQCWIR